MKKIVYAVSISLITFAMTGCAGTAKKTDSTQAGASPSALFSEVNPLQIGQYYLENLHHPDKSQELYDILTLETRQNISMEQFTDYAHTLSASITADTYYTVIPYDAYVFDNRVLCYYVAVYEKESIGGYALTELSLIRNRGIWQISLEPLLDKDISPMPVLEDGDIAEFTRRDMASFKDVISKRVKASMQPQQMPQEKDELFVEEPIEEKIIKKIKKEMVVGQAYFEVDNFEKAKESFDKILSYDPDHQTAREFLQKSIKGMAEQEKVRREKADQQRRENDKSRTAMEERIKQETEIKIQNALEQVRQKEREIEAIKLQQQSSIQQQPIQRPDKVPTIEDELFQQCFSQGESFYHSGEYRKAIVQFQKALGFQPENQLVHNYIKKCERAIQVAQ